MLKLLKLRKEKKEKELKLKELREKMKYFKKRGEELEAALKEAETEDDIALVEQDIEALEQEKGENGDLEGSAKQLEEEVAELEREIAETEERGSAAVNNQPEGNPTPNAIREREVNITMPFRKRYAELSFVEREQLVGREEVRSFLADVRQLLGTQNRAVNGTDVTIPAVLVDMIRPEVYENSKLIKYVNARGVKGQARETILGLPPEGIWMEMDEELSELEFGIYLAEVDGYKVGGFIPIPNYLLEDSDIALLNEIMRYIGVAIAYALDKAIVKGKGTKQPLGIITRLEQSSKPEGYPKTMPEWEDLRETHIIEASGPDITGKQLFKELIIAFGKCYSKYSLNQGKVFVMNEETKSNLMAKLVEYDSSGTIVASLKDTMPILGGTIEIGDYMDDGEILGGYFKPYLLAERAGTKIATSEHVRFIEDETVVKGTARYDGTPVIAESWVLFKLNFEDSE